MGAGNPIRTEEPDKDSGDLSVVEERGSDKTLHHMLDQNQKGSVANGGQVTLSSLAQQLLQKLSDPGAVGRAAACAPASMLWRRDGVTASQYGAFSGLNLLVV